MPSPITIHGITQTPKAKTPPCTAAPLIYHDSRHHPKPKATHHGITQSQRQMLFMRQATRRPQLSLYVRASGDHLETAAVLLTVRLICSPCSSVLSLRVCSAHRPDDHLCSPATSHCMRLFCSPCVVFEFLLIFLNENACWKLDYVEMHANASINFFF